MGHLAYCTGHPLETLEYEGEGTISYNAFRSLKKIALVAYTKLRLALKNFKFSGSEMTQT